MLIRVCKRMILTPVAIGVLLLIGAVFWATHSARAQAETAKFVCEHKLHLPILVPRAVYDFRDYCGGEITVF